MRDPLPYQVPALQYAAEKDLAAILMEKRLGKCKVAIHWAKHRDARRILVVAPKSACPDWLRELELEDESGFLLDGSAADRVSTVADLDKINIDKRVFFITNPQGLIVTGRKIKCLACDGTGKLAVPSQGDNTEMIETTCNTCNGDGKVKRQTGPTHIALLPWDAVIWDERLGLSNPRSLTNQVARENLQPPYRCLLTGEIAPEGPEQIFEQMAWVFGSFMGRRKFWPWLQDNFNKIGYGWFPKPHKLQEIKEAMHARSFRLTRKDAGVGEQKTFERRYCEMPAWLRRHYEHAIKMYELPPRPDGSVDEAKYALEVATWLAQMAGGYIKDRTDLDSPHKMQLLEELLLDEYKTERLVVTFRFNRELYNAEAMLKRNGFAYAAITGETPVMMRKEIQDKFRDGRRQILLMQVKVAKFGIDLSAADTMIRYSLPYSFEDISQSEDRIVHPQKKRPLHYIDLVCKDSPDEDVVDALGEKRVNARFFMSKLKSRLVDRLRAGQKC